jgi:general secretion pathway protein N
LQLGGSVSLATPGLELDAAAGRLKYSGRADVDLRQVSSRLSTLDALGSYRLVLSGDATGKDSALLTLSTTEGSLRLSGSGQWSPSKLRFRGDARAAEGSEAVLPRGKAPVTVNFVNADIEAVTRAFAAMIDRQIASTRA